MQGSFEGTMDPKNKSCAIFTGIQVLVSRLCQNIMILQAYQLASASLAHCYHGSRLQTQTSTLSAAFTNCICIHGLHQQPSHRFRNPHQPELTGHIQVTTAMSHSLWNQAQKVLTILAARLSITLPPQLLIPFAHSAPISKLFWSSFKGRLERLSLLLGPV